ncbi:MAG TPA: rod-binding protein [bacterium]|nr:rod-binding protein [bacterium]
MNFLVPPVSTTPLELLGSSKPLPMNGLGTAFALKPSLASAAASQVMLGPSGLNHLTKSLSPATLNPLSGLPSHSEAELKSVAQNFESLFMEMLMKEMRNSVQKSNLLGNSRGMEFFESMYDEQLTQKLASSGGLGLGHMVYERLKQVTLPHQKTFS